MLCSTVTIVNDAVLHIWILLRVDPKCSHHKKKKSVTMCGVNYRW